MQYCVSINVKLMQYKSYALYSYIHCILYMSSVLNEWLMCGVINVDVAMGERADTQERESKSCAGKFSEVVF